MSSEALAWLTVELAEKILKNAENDGTIEVVDLTTKPAVAKGENYGSEILRASVNYVHHNSGMKVMNTISMIVKIAPMVEGTSKTMMSMIQAFELEVNMMRITLVEMSHILNEKDYRLCPRVLYAEIADPSYIAMEDLSPMGYRMADRLVGLDLDHCLLAMRNLAKFHASSVALSEKDPTPQSMYNKGVYCADYIDDWKQFVASGMKSLGREVLNWLELGDERLSYSDKLLKFSEVCYNKAGECVNQGSSDFKVLNHGDFWLNNMLFRYDDDGKPIDHIFIDFQGPVWNSPAIDILNFLSTSLTEDVEIHNREDLLNEYLNVLTETMTRIRCKTKPPTAETLEKILRDYELYYLMSSCLFLPMTLLDKSKFRSLNELMQEDDSIKPGHKGLAFRKKMVRRLPGWIARGLLNV